MITCKIHTAKATCELLPSGIAEVKYYGVLDKYAFDFLREKMVRHTNGLHACVVRMDTGLTAFSDLLPLPRVIYRKDSPTAAVVVHEGQYEMWWAYAHALAEIGVMRAVFLASQQEMAYRWAVAQARAALSESLR